MRRANVTHAEAAWFGSAGHPPPAMWANGSCRPSAHRLGEASLVGGTFRGVADAVATTPSAPRSRPLAATLVGGLGPGSLRVHAPCRESGHGSRLGFPGRRPPRGPTASGKVARDLRVLLSGRDPGRSEGLRTPAETQTRFPLPQAAPLAGSRVAAASARPPGGEMRPQQQIFLVIGWCVSSPRTDGHAVDRTRRLPLAPPVGLSRGTPAGRPGPGARSGISDKPDGACLGRAPLLALGDIGRRTTRPRFLDVKA
jgi:hypothetical protein